MSVSAQRLGATLGGVALAVATAFISFGASIVAAIAVVVGWYVARRRGQPFTLGVSWVVGVCVVGVVVVAVVGVAAALAPAGTFSGVGRVLDSAQSQPPPPPPEWLRKITPPGQQQTPITSTLVTSHAFNVWVMIVGGGLVLATVAAYAGTLGWGAALLLVYGLSGSWLKRASAPGA